MAPWLVVLRHLEAPRLRILCLPFAGGGTVAYRPWAAAAPPGVELLAARLPGRETRLREAPLDSLADVVAGIVNALENGADVPLALFGHSMGAALAHEVAHALDAGGRPPVAVMVSGRRAPCLPRRAAPLADLPDAEFIAVLRRMGGTPPEVFEHRELLDLVLPVLRADFRLSEGFHGIAPRPFPCPLLAVAGQDDTHAPPDEVARWQDHAAPGAPFTMRTYPGGHFFLHDHRAELLSLLVRAAGLR